MCPAAEFLAALFPSLPDDEQAVLIAFHGDPGSIRPQAWYPRPWVPGNRLTFHARANAYVCISTYRTDQRGVVRRRRDHFAASYAFMIDDVGTKVPREAVEPLPASAWIETSPGNFQVWYFLDQPARNIESVPWLAQAFCKTLDITDPGMAGHSRVGRLPGYVNGKPAAEGWVVKLHELEDRRYSVADIAKGLRLHGRPGRAKAKEPPKIVLDDYYVQKRKEVFGGYARWLRDHGYLKTTRPDGAGWLAMRCPWIDEHTNRDDTGTGLAIPSEANQYFGGFHCHHGHCAERGWQQLTEWVVERSHEELNQAADAHEAENT